MLRNYVDCITDAAIMRSMNLFAATVPAAVAVVMVAPAQQESAADILQQVYDTMREDGCFSGDAVWAWHHPKEYGELLQQEVERCRRGAPMQPELWLKAWMERYCTPFKPELGGGRIPELWPKLVAAGLRWESLPEQERQSVLRHFIMVAQDSELLPANVAAGQRHYEKIMALIMELADVKVRDEDGYTLLHAAAIWGNPELIRRMITAGAEVNAADSHGRTPLYRAVENASYDSYAPLLAAGARMHVVACGVYGKCSLLKVVEMTHGYNEMADILHRVSDAAVAAAYRVVERLGEDGLLRDEGADAGLRAKVAQLREHAEAVQSGRETLGNFAWLPTLQVLYAGAEKKMPQWIEVELKAAAEAKEAE